MELKGKERQVKKRRQLGKKRGRLRRRNRLQQKSRKGLRRRYRRRGAEKARWCRVVSQASNTTVIWTWHRGRSAVLGYNKGAHREKVGDGTRSGVRKRRWLPMWEGSTKEKEGRLKVKKKWKADGRQSVVRSAGHRGYKNVRDRGTDYAAKKVRRKANKRMRRSYKQSLSLSEREAKRESKIHRRIAVHVLLEGKGKGSYFVRKMRRERKQKSPTGRGKLVKLCSVSDRTGEPHNGCKGKKRRRR